MLDLLLALEGPSKLLDALFQDLEQFFQRTSLSNTLLLKPRLFHCVNPAFTVSDGFAFYGRFSPQWKLIFKSFAWHSPASLDTCFRLNFEARAKFLAVLCFQPERKKLIWKSRSIILRRFAVDMLWLMAFWSPIFFGLFFEIYFWKQIFKTSMKARFKL